MTSVPPPAVDISDALVAELRSLGADLVDSSFTTASISALRRDLHLAIRSLLGFTITLTVPGPAVSVAITVADLPIEPDDVADCLAVQLPPSAECTASLTLYSATENSLADLRGDLAYAFDLPPATLTATPGPELIQPGISGFELFCSVHQAVGALLAAGHSRRSAGIELTRRAHTAGLAAAAQQILDESVPAR